MLHKIVYICIALHCAAMTQSADRRFILEIRNVTCFNYTERVKFIECEFEKFALSSYGYSVRLMFNRNLDTNFRARSIFDITPTNSKKVMHVFDIKLNVCVLLQQMTSNMFLKNILIELKRTSNLPTSCPVKGNVVYRQDNFSITDALFPSYMPLLNFAYTAELYERNKLICMWQIAGATVAKSK